jgi:hypothetical protein
MYILQWIESNLSEVILIITAVVLTVTAIFIGYQWKSIKTTSSIQLLHELLNLYRLPKARNAYRRLNEFLRDDCEGKKENVNTTYINFRNDENRRQEFDAFDHRRAYISHFYQMLATYHEKEFIKDELIFETWNENNLRIL